MLSAASLTYLKSDNATEVTVPLSADVMVRDIKFGVKKFSFEVEAWGGGSIGSGRGRAVTWTLAASGLKEKEHWMEAIEVATGKRARPSASAHSYTLSLLET